MDYGLSAPEQAVREMAREFALRDARPGTAARDAAHAFPGELYRRCGELGLTGIAFPEEYGGSGSGRLPFVLALEELALTARTARPCANCWTRCGRPGPGTW